MIDFIPLPLYTPIFNFFILFLVIWTSFQGFTNKIFTKDAKSANTIIGIVIALVLIFYIGLRPISGFYFGDTISYANSFFILQENYDQFELFYSGEWLFNSIMLWFAMYSNIHIFFLFCALVYVGALWWALVRIFKEEYFVPLIVAISMFTFFSYGVNGVRNGMASSVMILALSYRRNLPIAILLSIMALGIHKSLTLTVCAAGLAMFVKNPKLFLLGWFGSILVSLTTGDVVSTMIVEKEWIGDDRFASYIEPDILSDSYGGGKFRWDFLAYSAIPVLVGYYFIIKRDYTNKFYIWLFNIYLTTNAFWIIVIRANFSNRFAQISWFIMPLVLIYPFVMGKFWNDQTRKIGWAVIFFYLYTFYSAMIKNSTIQ